MQKGDVVKSLKGRDVGHIYVAVDVVGNVAYLADGRGRKVQNPKKKNVKHLEIIASTQDFIARDTEVRKYCKI